MRIYMLVPGGQELGTSPSENFARAVEMRNPDISVTVGNLRFGTNLKVDFRKFDLLWGDSDVGNVPVKVAAFAKKSKKPCYIHAEWLPPFRFEEGWSDRYNEATDLTHRQHYLDMVKAMERADLVSFAVSSTPGGKEWIEERTGVRFGNAFVRYPTCPLYDYIDDRQRKRQVATIARARAGIKRVMHTVKAISLMRHPPPYYVIGGTDKDIGDRMGVDLHMLGAWNKPKKVELFRESSLAVQHWSGIPPAEAIQQHCVVIGYDIPEMRELYKDAIVWVPENDIVALSRTIESWLDDHVHSDAQAKHAYQLFRTGQLNVKPEPAQVDEVVARLRKLVR